MATSQPQTPRSVGASFLLTYYTTMSTKPDQLHLFYKSNSQLTCSIENNAGQEIATGLEEIEKKIQSLGYKESTVELSSVDFQETANGSILIFARGKLTNNGAPRKFVQTFVLAAQNKGYYVLNDILHYLEDTQTTEATEAVAPHAEAQTNVQAPAPEPVHAKQPEPVEEKPKTEAKPTPNPNNQSTAPVQPTQQQVKETPPATQEVKTHQTQQTHQTQSNNHVQAPSKKEAQAPKNEKKSAPPQEKPAQPNAPKTWANIISNQPSTSAPVQAAEPETQPSPPVKKVTPPAEKKERKEPKDDKNTSAYVGNVPQGVSEEKIKKIFAKFGEIKSVTINPQKSYVFVDFATRQSLNSLIEDSGEFSLDGNTLVIKEKKPMVSNRGYDKEKGPRDPSKRANGRPSGPRNPQENSQAKRG